MWFRYTDYGAGGYKKLDYERVYVEADTQESANNIFNRATGYHADSGANFGCYASDTGPEPEDYRDKDILILGKSGGVKIIKLLLTLREIEHVRGLLQWDDSDPALSDEVIDKLDYAWKYEN